EELLEDLGAVAKVQSSKSKIQGQEPLTPALSPSDGERETSPSRITHQESRITPLGRKMLAFPVHPRYARMVLAAQDFGCVYAACLVAALTQGRDLLLRNVDRDTARRREDLLGEKAGSDFWILMRAWNYAAKNDCRLEACRRLGIHAVTA